MKELSIEEKAKRYDEIMNRAKKELDACGSQDCDAARQIFRLFPELKESEDERVRKALIEAFSRPPGHNCVNVFNGIPHRRILAWLEKQGEQNPAWSEDDKRMIDNIIFELEENQENISGVGYKIDWLQSLRPQSQWKPSDEQMEALRIAGEIGSANNSWAMGFLKGMYQDLKKLKD